MFKKPTILLADDDSALLNALSIRLREFGYELITATDGYTALALATEKQPDLLILDVNMPAGDGFSVQERLQKTDGHNDVPVIYLTGDQSERLDDLASRLGAVTLFHKPFQLDALLEAIHAALKSRAA